MVAKYPIYAYTIKVRNTTFFVVSRKVETHFNTFVQNAFGRREEVFPYLYRVISYKLQPINY